MENIPQTVQVAMLNYSNNGDYSTDCTSDDADYSCCKYVFLLYSTLANVKICKLRLSQWKLFTDTDFKLISSSLVNKCFSIRNDRDTSSPSEMMLRKTGSLQQTGTSS